MPLKVDIEDRLLSTILSPEDLAELENAGITKDSFPIRREVFEFIRRYNLKYTGVPSHDLISSQFEDFTFYPDVDEEEKNYLIDEVIKNDIRNKALKILNKGSDLLISDPEGAVDFISEKLASIKTMEKTSKSLTDAEALKRLSKLEDKENLFKENKVSGIRTGLSLFDDKLLGWHPGNLVSVIGRPNTGKSWLVEYLSSVAYLDNCRVLFISPEMTIEEVELRWDTIISRLLGKGFSNNDLLLGKVDLKKYEKYLNDISRRKDWLTIDSNNGRPFTIQAIQNFTETFKPDVVCVDGFLLLKSENRSDSKWQDYQEMAYGLKNIAQSQKIVMFVTGQANRTAGGGMPELNEIFGGDALAQASDVVIMLSKDPDSPMTRDMTIPKVRSCPTYPRSYKITFDVDKGKIGV